MCCHLCCHYGRHIPLCHPDFPVLPGVYWYEPPEARVPTPASIKQLFDGHLTLRDYDAQAGEAMSIIRALNKMTRAGMPESVRIA